MSNSELVSLWRVGIVLGVGILSILLLNLGLHGLQSRLKKSGTTGDHGKRLNTFIHAGRSIGWILIILMVLLMILHELGINITPVLASAGVVGLAVSLGGQTVIKDFLAGLIILTENQFTIGDTITIGQLTGTVEHVSLRATFLRDAEGKLNLIPNGDIRTITNLTTQWSQVVIMLNFDFETDMDKVL
jgi:small-conductance mechanosensitive channel